MVIPMLRRCRLSPRPVRLRSRHGADGPLGFLVALPAWWATMGVLLVLGYWFWSLAANAIGLARSGQAVAVGHNGEMARRSYVATALGGFAQPYGQAEYTQLGRAVVSGVNMTVEVSAFPAPDALRLQARNVSRVERFYPRAPSLGWE